MIGTIARRIWLHTLMSVTAFGLNVNIAMSDKPGAWVNGVMAGIVAGCFLCLVIVTWQRVWDELA